MNKVAQFSVPHDEGDPLFVCDATQQLASLFCPETEQLDRSLTVLSAEAESAAKSGDDFFDRFGFDWQEGYQMTLIAADINLAMARMAASHFAQQCTLPCTAYDPVEYSAGAYREVNIDHRVIFIDTPNYNKSRSRYIRREEKYLRDYIDHCYSISTDSPSSKANTLYLSAPREALLTPVVIAAALQSMINRLAAVTPQWVGKGVFQDFPVLGK
ncbi:phosphoheptose isomerase family protein [Lacticaseibacillus hegangensis]|uniref:Uncharacterized protein n=1 Tax=Lacticaseibacillus hegangensis TaxID=2486010 RepID=A0ABW4CXP1_9LACO|nr:hypothetical protein [Lacticaseibacillus hegangensis]